MPLDVSTSGHGIPHLTYDVGRMRTEVININIKWNKVTIIVVNLWS